ncbi:endonuclease [Candidatus Kaiserbacteria bacterium]|nr:MAG: endonuclease [Candidatus Kaiserbacteria bacterium]PCI89982.1 MAG: endonuclease [Candidatus Kaiserbacteria bacterium]
MYFLYILECDDGTLYTGITTDVARRLYEHQNKKGGHYTRAHGAKRVVYTEKHKDRSSVQKREAQVKKLSRIEKMKLVRAC